MQQLLVRIGITVAVALSIGAHARAQSTFAPGVPFTEDIVLSGLPPATAVAFGPDKRIFIALKDGIVRVALNGVLQPTPFIDISSEVNRSTDRGLLAIALDPDFPSRPFVYLFYSYDPPEVTDDLPLPRLSKLVRVTADAAKNYNVALSGAPEVILGKNSKVEHMIESTPLSGAMPYPASCMTGKTMEGTPIEDCFPADGLSHTAGSLLFGSDKSLYLTYGDGSDYNGANQGAIRAQLLDSLAGKVLRIDPNTGAGLPGNPFYNSAAKATNRSRVWAYGVRNAFRIAINPANDQLYLGDVGSSRYEELNVGKGSNFGWPCYEGGVAPGAGDESSNTMSLPSESFQTYSRTKYICDPLYNTPGAVTPPVYSYKHLYIDGKDQGASITGVAFYSGNIYPAPYQKALFYADYAQHYIRYLTFDPQGKPTSFPFSTEQSPFAGVVQLIVGPDTNIYALYLDLKAKVSQLRRIRATGGANVPPRVVVKATPLAGSIPLVVSFRSDGTIDPEGQPLKFEWNFGDATALSTEPHPTHVYQKVGTFTATVTVSETTTPFASTKSSVTIRTGVTPPKAFIDSPLTGTTYRIGEIINFSGHAEFNQPANSPPVALTWSILQRHNNHEHLLGETTGSAGSFVTSEHTDDSSYELCLFASAGTGLEDQKCLPLLPKVTSYTFASEPVGAPIAYIDEGREVLAPHIAKPIVDSTQTISAAARHAGRSFVRWSDGVSNPERSFVVGTTPLTFTAVYQNLAPTAVIRSSQPSGQVPFAVQLDGSASTDPEGGELQYSWTVGNGAPLTGALQNETLTTPGDYLVRLTVTDSLGLSNSAELLVSVFGATPTPTPTTGGSSSPIPTAQPTARPTLPVSATQPPAGTTSILPPKGQLVLSALGRNCGGVKRPCVLPINPQIVLTGSVPRSALVLTAFDLKLIIERSTGKGYRRIAQVAVTESIGRRRLFKFAGKFLRQRGLYRLVIESTIPGNPAVVRSRARFVVAGQPIVVATPTVAPTGTATPVK